MSQLHQLQRANKNSKEKPRVGHGGKRGTYSGRGQSGQGQHAGRRTRPAIYDLMMRLPKLRGRGRNSFKSLTGKPAVLNLKDLMKLKPEIKEVTVAVLLEAGLIKKSTINKSSGKIKILNNGPISRKFTFVGMTLSKKAQESVS